jgi:CheY-like chemotaxis protein
MNICIVDDTASQRLVLSTILKGAGYSEIYAVPTASAAFEILGMAGTPPEQSIDLILMDISMPDIDGIEACRQIKALPETCDIPIIMVTASTEVADLQQAFDAGAIDYITKPVLKLDLLVRVRSALKLKHEMDARKTQQQELLELTEYLEAANRVLIQQQQKSDRLLRTIYEIGQSVHALASFPERLQTMIASINNIISYTAAEICLYDAERQRLVLAVIANPLYTQSVLSAEREYDSQLGYRSLLIARKRGLLIPDVETFSEILPAPDEHWQDIPPRSYVGVPMILNDDVVGTIELVSKHPHNFSNDNLRFLQSIAMQAASAVGHAREEQRRESQIQQQITDLNIEIDAEKRSRQVDAIVGSDFFQMISQKAQEIRSRRTAS